MRYKIAEEGLDLGSHYIFPEAIHWDDEPILVMDGGHTTLLGWASDLRREGSEITAEIAWNEGFDDEMMRYLGGAFYSMTFDSHKFDNVMWVTDVLIEDIVMVAGVPWSGARPMAEVKK